MDLVTMKDLNALVNCEPGWCVSMFMPAHRAGRETEQDPIRFKNMLRQAEQSLQDKGLRTPDLKQILQPAYNLLDDSRFWRVQSDGLAVFSSVSETRSYRVPLRFDELVVVSDRFHLKPILPLATSDSHFYILALSQKHVRLLEGTRFTVDEVDIENLPQSLADTVQFETFEKQLSVRSVERGSPGRTGIFHGHDIGDKIHNQIVRWFRQIDQGVQQVFTGLASPLVLTGVDSLVSVYREVNSYAGLMEGSVSGTPDALTHDELHERAWGIVQPYFMQAQEQAMALYRQLAGTGRTTGDVTEAVLAAYHGRIESLIVPVGIQVWGRADLEFGNVEVHGARQPGDTDLLDLAAIQTLVNGGKVFAVEQGIVPQQGSLAAVFRY